jgi:hypothetical protein
MLADFLSCLSLEGSPEFLWEQVLVERGSSGQLRNGALLGSILLGVCLNTVKRINISLALVTVLRIVIGLGEGLGWGIGIALRGFGVERASVEIVLKLLLGFDLALLLASQELGFLQVGVTL